MTFAVSLPDPEATASLARQVVAALPEIPAGWLILLEGELGSGKSTFARALLRAYGHEGAVPSPTYTLVEPYSLPGFDVYHIDLYRIADDGELEFLGWSDLDNGLRLVEWPARVPDLYAGSDLLVSLSYAEEGRLAELSASSERGEELIRNLPDYSTSYQP